MAIASRPKRNQNDILNKPTPDQEKAAAKFIEGAGKKEAREQEGKGVLIRFEPSMLGAIDTAAKRRGVSRAAWIRYTLSRALEHGDE